MSPPIAPPKAAPLAQQLAGATRALHHRAERSPFMATLLRGNLPRAPYVLLLRNLHALYSALECALDAHVHSPVVMPIRLPVLYRSAALQRDLVTLAGTSWGNLPLTAAMQHYVRRVEINGEAAPHLLAAHAYVRYLGDLSGGQVLRRIVAEALALQGDRGTAFYAFPEADVASLKAQFRSGLDQLPLHDDAVQAVVAEGISGFQRHVDLFDELAADTGIPPHR